MLFEMHRHAIFEDLGAVNDPGAAAEGAGSCGEADGGLWLHDAAVRPLPGRSPCWQPPLAGVTLTLVQHTTCLSSAFFHKNMAANLPNPSVL